MTLELRNASKIYAQRAALRSVSFALDGTGVVGLLGPNGSGKTTALRLLAGFFSPTCGLALLDGRPAVEAAPPRIGYLPEVAPLYSEMTVESYLVFVARLKGMAKKAGRAAVDEVIGALSLAERRTSLIGQLSRGYRQRVGLAQALVHRPGIVLLDEPTAGLDPIQIEEARAVIREAGRRATVLMSTHLLNEVCLLCGRVLVLRDGELRGELPVAAPANRWRVTVRGDAAKLYEAIRAAGLTRKAAPDECAAAGAENVVTAEVSGESADAAEALAVAILRSGLGLRVLEPLRCDLASDYAKLQKSAPDADSSESPRAASAG